ncbi:trafficking protein-like protein particle complex subunit 1 [Curvularia clavata]|uniref:Trafficking protein particle complex subunit n=1 Tax=Curvularia clavata TaxID=95742 RepID=A0A9Q8Z8F1_CURCL|nr:trafficking protein-like protein particle complex subunit 1 [Curvularia clavata]
MVLYSFYIFDRHTECIYSRRWTPARPTSSSSKTAPRPTSGNSIASNGDVVAAVRKGMSHSDDEKLVFGLVFSLRNFVTKLGGADDTFLSYRTGEYKLHYYETPTRMKFVMLTDTKVINLRQYLHQIWANLYVEYVVKNPLAPVEHPGGIGVANELFERGLEAFITAVLPV